MTNEMSDEMLMAFVDGELDPAAENDVRLATERDPALARRANEFRRARDLTRGAFARVLSEPPSDRLIAAAMGGANVVPMRRRPMLKAALPLAASIAILFGLGGYWVGQMNSTGGILGSGAVAEAVRGTISGETRTVALGSSSARLETLATYKVEGGFCRSFSLTAINEASRGVACDRGSGWRVEVTVAAPAGATYAPASSEQLAVIDGFLDAAGAGSPLGKEEEAAALKTR